MSSAARREVRTRLRQLLEGNTEIASWRWAPSQLQLVCGFENQAPNGCFEKKKKTTGFVFMSLESSARFYTMAARGCERCLPRQQRSVIFRAALGLLLADKAAL